VVDNAATPDRAVDMDDADLARVKAQSEAKLMRHRFDDYLAVVLGVGAALVLWILQMFDLY
jgi:hypothetical protein